MMLAMRTTVTFEPETERLLREAMRQRGQSFKEVLNQAVVRGLADLRCGAEEAPFVPRTFPMGLLTKRYRMADMNQYNEA